MPTAKKTTAKAKSATATKRAVAPKRAAAKRTTQTAKPAATATHVCTCAQTCRTGESFWVNFGPVIDSVEGLAEALRHMTDEQYAYHTKRDGNDFARWLRDSFGDDAAAMRMERARSRTGAIRAISVVCTAHNS